MNITQPAYIKVTIKNVYGVEKIYPADEKSMVFARLVGQKTLTREDIAHIKDLGYAVQVVQEPVEL